MTEAKPLRCCMCGSNKDLWTHITQDGEYQDEWILCQGCLSTTVIQSIMQIVLVTSHEGEGWVQ